MEGLIRAGAPMGCAVAVTLVVACNAKPAAPTPVEVRWTENGERFLIKGSTDVPDEDVKAWLKSRLHG